MTYSCFCYLDVIAKDGEVELEKYVELPFAPFVGMTIVFNHEDCDYFHIQHVEWSVEYGDFWVYGEPDEMDDCPCTPEDACCCLDYDDRIKNGWTVYAGPRYGRDRIHSRPYIFGDDVLPRVVRAEE